MDRLRIAIAAWEPGRAKSGLGAQIGGLGVIIEELPAELIQAAAKQGIKLEIEVLTPCFAHCDKTRMKKLDRGYPATLSEITFAFDAYEHVFEDGIKLVYFWDEGQLSWTTPTAIYPQDPQMALRLYASVSQAMAGYIQEQSFDAIHLHDYHVGLLPFYLGDDLLEKIPVHLTIHNATYQGITPLVDGGYSSLDRIALPGRDLFHQYFDFFDNLNLMKACMLKVHQCGGKITTVSGDIGATWGYAAELRQNRAEIYSRAFLQKGSAPGKVFVPNRHLDLFEKLPIAGITNGMSDRNRPENLPELKSKVLNALQEQQKNAGRDEPLFRNPVTQKEMLARDHSFNADHLEVKRELKRLLHLEAFGSEPEGDPILLTAVGRLVDQKNLGLAASIVEWTLKHDPRAKFIILASATPGDPAGMADEAEFARLAYWYRNRVFFHNTFNLPLSKLILAGGDFCLIPSRFEPCGLVDYEASLLGNIVIGRATGGLTKVSHCAYLYDWLDISDRMGEAGAFFSRIATAINNYRRHPEWHRTLIRTAMDIDASWDTSAAQYLRMYRYGFLMKQWHAERKRLIANFAGSLGEDLHTFSEFFIPGREVYGDAFDWQLRKALTAGTKV